MHHTVKKHRDTGAKAHMVTQRTGEERKETHGLLTHRAGYQDTGGIHWDGAGNHRGGKPTQAGSVKQ